MSTVEKAKFSHETLSAIKVIISHENPDGTPCPDGMASAILLQDALPGREVRFTSYGSKLRSIRPEPGMLFCDICPEAEDAPAFVEAGAIVLDHHESRREVVALFGERGVFGENSLLESGAALAFKYVWSYVWSGFMLSAGAYANAKRFTHLAAVRDTWQVGSEDWQAACELSAALAFYDWETLGAIKKPFQEYAQEMALDWGEDSLQGLLAIGKHLVRKRKAHIAKMAADIKGTAKLISQYGAGTGTGYRVIMANVFSSADASELADALMGETDIVAGYRVLSNGKVLVSLRSRKGVDVSQVAAFFGGGGHAGAAGFSALCEGHPEEVIRSSLERAFTAFENCGAVGVVELYTGKPIHGALVEVHSEHDWQEVNGVLKCSRCSVEKEELARKDM